MKSNKQTSKDDQDSLMNEGFSETAKRLQGENQTSIEAMAKVICDEVWKLGLLHKDWDRLSKADRLPFVAIARSVAQHNFDTEMNKLEEEATNG